LSEQESELCGTALSFEPVCAESTETLTSFFRRQAGN
jgi:hypothetical protein